MTTWLCPHFTSRKSYYAATLSFLLLLIGPSSTQGLRSAALRAEQEERLRIRSGAIADTKTETGYDNRHSSRLEVAVQEDAIAPRFGTSVRELHSSSRCVPIPLGMALCQHIGYDTMRMPNLLGHDSSAEAIQQSSSWLPLLARECHPDARIFLCSLFAPICLDRFISPCRSLCESVRDSCAPIMGCYGYPWPDILRCDQYPADHFMCISSITNVTVHTVGHRVPQASCQDCELERTSSLKDMLETFCRSDFVVKLRLTRLKYSPVSLSQFSLAAKLTVLKHGPLLGGEIRSRVELWLERDATCVKNITRHHQQGGTFLVTGTVQGERLVVNKAYIWQRSDKNLMAAARRWKHHRCRR
ncbi:secreted frizzled-related protein 2 [Thalassophryne amazonica]|uniref:secreted frizzled-related protein 2 n=1 Tax=Thalassophryne amazonica TaxID=390379 RepID=UPI001470EAD4|nr:secreted frizzled-related protein 2 [Thalassophryne amazonica]